MKKLCLFVFPVLVFTLFATLAYTKPQPKERPESRAMEEVFAIAGGGYRLGVELSEISPHLRDDLKIESGVMIERVLPDSAAAKAGLRDGDIILKMDGEAMDSEREIRDALREMETSRPISLDIYRDGKTLQMTVTPEMKEFRRISLGQPSDRKTEFTALKALVTCPTASIGVIGQHPIHEAVHAFPDLIEEDVYFCGYASESSFGASSYLVVRSEGNVLVDSPRFAKPLVKNVEALGGIRYIFLTHKDDVADHEQWANHFGAKRLMHKDDAGRLLTKIDSVITGVQDVPFDQDWRVIPTPGHTRGHLNFLYKDRFLFTGDHLWWSPNYQSLHASRSVCWYSWPEQVRSVAKLKGYSFDWVLPGHGMRIHAPREHMQEFLDEAIRRISS